MSGVIVKKRGRPRKIQVLEEFQDAPASIVEEEPSETQNALVEKLIKQEIKLHNLTKLITCCLQILETPLNI